MGTLILREPFQLFVFDLADHGRVRAFLQVCFSRVSNPSPVDWGSSHRRIHWWFGCIGGRRMGVSQTCHFLTLPRSSSSPTLNWKLPLGNNGKRCSKAPLQIEKVVRLGRVYPHHPEPKKQSQA